MNDILKIGTRGSALALRQTEMVLAALGDVPFEVIKIKTSGDKDQTTPLHEIGGKELFTKEIDEALLDGRIDIAVHSLKDVAGILDDNIIIAATLPRADIRDVLIGAENLSALPKGARIGTSSPRRKAQILALRNDLIIEDIRGNVNTRINKVKSGEYDATILAAAGLNRLGILEFQNYISIEEMLPAIGQAAIAIACRSDDVKSKALLEKINHKETFTQIMAERAALKEFGADCHTPIAANAIIQNEKITLRGFIANDTCDKHSTTELNGNISDAEKLGVQMGKLLKEMYSKL